MLTGSQKHYLRGLAHHRKPVVTIGANGLTEAVLSEIDEALAHHELIKVKLPAAGSDRKRAILDEICRATRAMPVQAIGRVGVLYRPSDEPVIKLPDA
jgi:RNA-binding protein